MTPSRPLPSTWAAIRWGIETRPAEISIMAGARLAISVSMLSRDSTCPRSSTSMGSIHRHRAFLGAGELRFRLFDIVDGEVIEIAPVAVLLLEHGQDRVAQCLAGFARGARRRHLLP